MVRSYKYRIYPSKRQIKQLNDILEECRWVYNETLATRNAVYNHTGQNLSRFDTHKLLPIWKRHRPTLNKVHSQSLQNVQYRVDLAFQAFFRRVKNGEKPGYPRFKNNNRYNSITYPQYPLGCVLIDNKIKVSKIGLIPILLDKQVNGKIKTITLIKNMTNKWFVIFSCEVENKINNNKLSENSIGIDVGLTNFATLSNGEKIDNPRFFKQDQKALAKAQRKLSRQKKGTKERYKARKVVARIYERISNRRNNFAHQLSRKLINIFGVICIEDLNINEMMINKKFSRSISDVAWGQFIRFLTYKAEEAGGQVIKVDPKNTSQWCSSCGEIVKKDLSVRIHNCPCGLILDRDINAARNIQRLGLQSLAQQCA